MMTWPNQSAAGKAEWTFQFRFAVRAFWSRVAGLLTFGGIAIMRLLRLTCTLGFAVAFAGCSGPPAAPPSQSSGAASAEEAVVLISKVENGVPVTFADTNATSCSRLMRNVEKQSPNVKPDSPRQWRKTYDAFSQALVKSAKEVDLHSNALEELLKRLPNAKENRGLAVVPVAVHQTREKGELVWIIVLKWEDEKAVAEGSHMAHIRYFIFTQKNSKQTGFVTCG